MYFAHAAFVHITHIVAGYWLGKGTKKGYVLGIIVGIYETFLFIAITPDASATPHGIAFRILFGIVVWLIISGRKELVNLQSANWRPWGIFRVVKEFRN